MKPNIFFLVVLISIIFSFHFSCKTGETNTEQPITFNIPEGFELEDLYSPGQHDQGSWVSITEGPNELFYACDQYGAIYTFDKPEIGQKLDPSNVKPVDLDIGFAQGMLWAFNSLYVVVVKESERENPDGPSSGVYRLQDTNGDGILDERKKILTVNGQGEHGPHTMRVGPDEKTLYLIAGNFNKVPDHFKSRLPKTWQEDNLFPPYLDARGHAVDLKAPGGWIAKTDPEGESWELIGAGMRNPFSFGFNSDGEILAYDADMEWDFGMPWYRPTRILHITSGAEFGWRTGSGKWPVYYPDNLPPVENMAQGSPTAVIMGKDLRFPSKYKNGLFACDWSFGTIYYVDIQEDGSSYKGEKEEFLSGTPLPISNAIAGSDGNLYFLTGGRRLTSHMYRLRYTGDQNVETDKTIVKNSEASQLRDIRKLLEKYHDGAHQNAVTEAWPFLNHEDRFIQYAARIAIEHQPISDWEIILKSEKDPVKIIYGTLAYVRASSINGDWVYAKLDEAGWAKLSLQQKTALIRVYALQMMRHGKPDVKTVQRIIRKFSPLFPSNESQLDRELSQLLLFLESNDAVEKSMAILDSYATKENATNSEILSVETLERSKQYGPQIAEMLKNLPPTEAIQYVTILSHVKHGWTKELRTRYFDWFYKALSKKGGESYKVFLDNIRAKALENVPDEEKAFFGEISGFYSPTKALFDLPQPIGPGQPYNMYDIGRIATWSDDKLRNYEGRFEDGVRVYQAGLCSACHRMKGEGGGSGPDLTNIHTRFDKGAISAALLSPNEEISDQYAFTIFHLKGDQKIVGRIVSETDNSYQIYQSPYDVTATIEVLKSDILSTELSPISPMPAKLLDRLNEQEVLDLFVYLLSGADENHEYYTHNSKPN